MKKILIIFFLTLPMSAWAAVTQHVYSRNIKDAAIQSPLSPLAQSATYEWGCPVSEVVPAKSGAEAVAKIQRECMEEAKKAAQLKPGVSDIIKISVIVPDVLVSQHEDGFFLKGTFFLETVVFRENFAGR